MAAIKESGGGYSKPRAAKAKANPATSQRNKPRKAKPSNASSAANKFSKAQKKGYAAVTKRNSNFVAQNKRNIRNTRRQNRAAAGSAGSTNPFATLGQGIRDFVGSVVPQDVLMNQNTQAIRRATKR